MTTMQADMIEFKRQLTKGPVRRAYQQLLSYMLDLRRHFQSKHTSCKVSGLYQGYMNITFFALFPKPLKQRDLKVAVVFNYETFRFEAWLTGRNRKVQRNYWKVFKDCRWDGCRVVEPAPGEDAIIQCTLADDLDFDDLDALTSRIENATLKFIDRIEAFLSKQEARR